MSALSVGGNPTLTRKEIHNKWGHFMKSKDIQNMKQAMSGLSSNVWSATKDILISLSNNPDNVVNVSTDDKGEIVCIYVQLAQQKKLYQKLVRSISLNISFE